MTKKGKQRGRQGKVSFVLQYQKKCWKSLMLMLARTSTFTDFIWTRQHTISKNELFSLWYLQKKFSLGPTQKEKHPNTKNAPTHPPTHRPTHPHTHTHTHINKNNSYGRRQNSGNKLIFPINVSCKRYILTFIKPFKISNLNNSKYLGGPL